MKLLVLGGTIFVGRHFVEAALVNGHEVTLFNRGQHNPDLYPDVEKLRGDRDGGLSALADGQWDAAVDTCGYVPRIVRDSAELLANAVEHYTFISSISVYADISQPGLNEESELGRLEDETIEEVTGETYGPLKALCEQSAEQVLPGRVLTIRPGLIVGPNDPTDRFTYWPVRMARGGETLVPEPPSAPVQIIDVRDLAKWMLQMIEEGQTGVFNAAGPDQPITMRGFLDSCNLATGNKASLTWVSEDYLLEAGVEPWSDLPLWLAGDEYGGMLTVNVDKAMGQGLTFRPLVQTAQDTYHWAQSRGADYESEAGLDVEREKQLLAGWHSRA